MNQPEFLSCRHTRFVLLPVAVALLGWGALALLSSDRSGEAPSGLSTEQTTNAGDEHSSAFRLTPRMRTRLREIVNDCVAEDGEAVRATVADAGAILDDYRERIPDFLDRVFSLKSKAVILWKTAGDGVNRLRRRRKSDGARSYIRGIWEDTMFSEEELASRISSEMASLRYRLAENRHEMASALLAEFGTMNSGDMQIRSVEHRSTDLCEALDAEIARIATQSSNGAIRGEGAALLLDAALTPVITKALLAVFRPVGTAAVTGAAGSGGATAAGLAGSPWSFGATIVVGVLIDLGVNHYARKQTHKKLRGFLDSVEDQLINGGNDAEGLRPILERSLEEYHDSLRRITVGTVLDFLHGC